MPSLAEKLLLGKKFKKHYLSSFQKTKSMQITGSVFAERIEQIGETEFKIALIKIVDSFLHGHGFLLVF